MDETTALTLPDEQTFRRDIAAINRFQDIVHANMKSGQDYGVIPGTRKPTLLKPGAEKIAKLLGLADLYEIIDRQEDWQTGFFRYLVKCKLVSVRNDVTISEGLGECNSLESKYRWRWVFPDDVPENIDKQKLLKRTGKRRDGKGTYTQYRLENEDIYSQVNTILKMAKKRALVDAALSAGRLSEVFTQDVEDMGIVPSESPVEPTQEPISPIRKKVIEKLQEEPAPATEPEVKSTAPKTDTPAPNIEQAERDSKELWPGGGSEGLSTEEPKGEIPKTKEQLFNYVAKHAGHKDTKFTRAYLVNKFHIPEKRIDEDIVATYYEVKALNDWPEYNGE